jgi:hypothetical protein
LLLGNILLRLGRYDQATEAFNEVLERYAPVRDELIRLRDSAADPVTYYEEIAARSRSGGGLLPPLAIRWAAEQKRLRRALAVVGDLERSETWIGESNEIVAKLLQVLASEQRAQFVPVLQEAQGRMFELENTLVAISSRLLAIERDIVGQVLDATKKAELDAVLAERASLEPEYRKLPHSREEYEGRLSEMQTRMKDTQKKAYRLKWDIEEMRRGVEGLGRFLEQNPQAFSPEDMKDVRDRVAQSVREIGVLEEMQRQLEAQIQTERNMINVTTAEGRRDEMVRARYLSTLERERQILGGGAGAVAGEKKASLDEVSAQREVIAQYYSELSNFKARLTRVINQKAVDVKAQILTEQGLLESYMEEIASAKEEAKRVVGEIAIGSLDEVQQSFRAIVLRGDVGIVDVAWALKEQQTHAISKRVNDQNRELQILDAEFQAVLEE